MPDPGVMPEAALKLALPDHRGRVMVAFSGGMDSIALLHAAAACWPGQIVAAHINHQLQAASGDFERFCAATCARLQVPLLIHRVERSPVRGESIEAFARNERYAGLQALADGQGISVVLTAHHQDDQIESLLLALARGADLAGLSGIAVRRIQGSTLLLRPWLGLRRAAIHDYAKAHALQWVNDPSNGDVRFKRNALRHEVIPLLERLLPQFVSQAARSVNRLQARLAVEQAASLQRMAGRSNMQESELSKTELLALTPEDRLIRIRQWLGARHMLMPSEAKLREISKQLTAPGAYGFVKHQGRLIRRYRESIRIHELETAAPPAPGARLFEADSLASSVVWALSADLAVRLQRSGMSSGQVELELAPVGLRQRWKPKSAAHSRELRHWCQALEIGADERRELWGIREKSAAQLPAPWLFIYRLGESAQASASGWSITLESADL